MPTYIITLNQHQVKKILFAALLLGSTSIGFAQHNHGSHEKQNSATLNDTTLISPAADTANQRQLSQLLTSYYHIKNALVAGDAGSAASNADVFLRSVNALDFKLISEGNAHILAKDAGNIAATKDLKSQRDYFVSLSANIASVAKTFKLGSEPIYLQYCPMKKASWLSAEKQVKNPYFGSAMLSCGQVLETL